MPFFKFLFKLIKPLLSNQIIFYLFSRYFTYFIQFIISIVLAVKLGAYYLGIWSFIVLIINYFGQIDFGIANSLNVFLIQNRDDSRISSIYIFNALLVLTFLSFLIVIIALYNFYFGFKLIEKFNVSSYFTFICLIGILQYFNTLFMTIFRVYNKLVEVIIHQSVVVILSLLIIFFFDKEDLILALVFAYLLGGIVSVIVYLASFPLRIKSAKISLNITMDILKKGMYLFVFNGCFYFIITSTRSLVSKYYTIEEFGVFSFAYTLSNSIMLLLSAFSFIMFPKLIQKLSSNCKDEALRSINMIMTNYVIFAHFMVYSFMIFFPFVSSYFSEYSGILGVLNFISLAVLLNTHSFGHVSFLIAQNREKTAALISLVALVINILIGVILIKLMLVPVKYVIVASGFSYIIFSFLSTYFSNLLLKGKTNFYAVFTDSFPLRIFLPFTAGVVVSYFDLGFWIIAVFIMFVYLNMRSLKEITHNFKLLWHSPQIINL